MNQPIGQGGEMAAMPPRSIGELLSAAFQLYRRHWRILLAIAAVVVVPLTLLQYGIGHWFRHGQPAPASSSCSVGYSMDLAVTRAVVWSLWPARSPSMAS
jgi:hypothetical protein